MSSGIVPIFGTSKICERIDLDQLMNYLDDNDLLTSHQSGNKNSFFTNFNLCTSCFLLRHTVTDIIFPPEIIYVIHPKITVDNYSPRNGPTFTLNAKILVSK